MNRQILGVLLGICAMVVISLIDYKWVLNFYWPMYFLNLVLLAAIWIPGLGVVTNGARRWLNLGFTQLQPSDLTQDPYDPFLCQIPCQTESGRLTTRR